MLITFWFFCNKHFYYAEKTTVPNNILSLFLKKADEGAQSSPNVYGCHTGATECTGSTSPPETQLLGSSFQGGEFFREDDAQKHKLHTTEKSFTCCFRSYAFMTIIDIILLIFNSLSPKK